MRPYSSLPLAQTVPTLLASTTLPISHCLRKPEIQYSTIRLGIWCEALKTGPIEGGPIDDGGEGFHKAWDLAAFSRWPHDTAHSKSQNPNKPSTTTAQQPVTSQTLSRSSQTASNLTISFFQTSKPSTQEEMAASRDFAGKLTQKMTGAVTPNPPWHPSNMEQLLPPPPTTTSGVSCPPRLRSLLTTTGVWRPPPIKGKRSAFFSSCGPRLQSSSPPVRLFPTITPLPRGLSTDLNSSPNQRRWRGRRLCEQRLDRRGAAPP